MQGATLVVQSAVHLDVVVRAHLFLLQLEAEKLELHVLARIRHDRPFAVGPIVVHARAELDVRVEVVLYLGRLQAAPASGRVAGEETLALDASVRIEHHVHLVGGRRDGVGDFGTTEPAQRVTVRGVAVIDDDMVVCTFLSVCQRIGTGLFVNENQKLPIVTGDNGKHTHTHTLT